MTRLFNDPARFADDMVSGFAAAHPEYVTAVPGGVVRAVRPRPVRSPSSPAAAAATTPRSAASSAPASPTAR